jgi:menaquinone-dependent protoporphyrinogen oxidase
MEILSRRQFLTDGALLAGGTLGTLALGSGMLAPRPAQAAKADFVQTQCGHSSNGAKKVLVAYTSYCGSTGEVAATMGQALCDQGLSVDVRQTKNIHDLTPYKAVVLGSAVRSSSWWPEAIEFVDGHEKELRHMPVAYFLTCLALYKDNPGSRKVARSYMDPVLNAVPSVKVIDMGFFAGALNYSKLNLIYRTVMKSKMKKRGVPQGDFRNFNAIRAWATGLAAPMSKA